MYILYELICLGALGVDSILIGHNMPDRRVGGVEKAKVVRGIKRRASSPLCVVNQMSWHKCIESSY